MPRDSPRSRTRYDDDVDRRTNRRGYDNDRPRYRDGSRSRREGDNRSKREEYREYGERERERERERDRERYDSGRNRDRERDKRSIIAGVTGPSSRRSASPPSRSSRPHSERPRSFSRSRSRSVSPLNKAKPNFAPSGLLAAETNTVRAANGDGTVLKYNEPPEARKPVLGWRLYVFKGSEQVGEHFYCVAIL